MPENTVKVDRTSRWGNPFRVGEVYVRRRMAPGGGERSNIVVDREHAVRLFRRFTARKDTYRVHAVEHLRGRNLACWCPLPKPGEPDICHASILLEIANAGVTISPRPAQVDAEVNP